MTWILLGLLIGLDNFAAATGLALLGLRREQRRRLIVAFVVFEAAMPVLGLALGEALREVLAEGGEWVGSIALAFCGLLAIHGALRYRAIAKPWDARVTSWLLPLALSLDNLMAGVALGASGWAGVPAALAAGAIAAGLCVMGLLCGAGMRPRFQRSASLVGGLLLVVLAVLSLTDIWS